MKKEYIIKFKAGYLYCPAIPWPTQGQIAPTPAQAKVFQSHVRAQEALDTYERIYGKGEILEGETVGHIIHRINLQEGNYVTCKPVSKLHRGD